MHTVVFVQFVHVYGPDAWSFNLHIFWWNFIWLHCKNSCDIYIYIYIIVEKSPNSSHMYDHGFMDNTNRQAVKNWLDSQTRDAFEFGLFSTIIAIIRACACWALFVVTLTNTVHLIYIYIYIYMRVCVCVFIYIYIYIYIMYMYIC